MANPAFFSISSDDRREVILAAAAALNRPANLLEKDVWVVWALDTVASAPFGNHLVFKGGTSLSKGYNVIRRFSEDVDLTLDIRQLVPGVTADVEVSPSNRSQADKLTDRVRAALPGWVRDSAMPTIQAGLDTDRLNASLRVEGDNLFIDYQALTEVSHYLKPSVRLEFGARSTGVPNSIRQITCDAAPQFESVAFPAATVRVMAPERTFWEKATAIHVFCSKGMRNSERAARHWHDLVRLDDAGYVDSALRNSSLAVQVANHKSMFFRETGIDYLAAVSGALCLIPEGEVLAAVRVDYTQMVGAGLLLDDSETFDDLMSRCADIQERANRR